MVVNKRRSALEYQLHSQEEIFGKIFNQTPVGIVLLQPPYNVLKVNPAALKIAQVRNEASLASWFALISQSLIPKKGLLYAVDREIAVKSKTGRRMFLLVRLTPVEDGNIIITLQDITTQKLSQRRLARLATLDSLTGLLNHKAVLLRLEQELSRARRYRLPLSVVLVDIDNFKEINDRHGHLKGDQALSFFAKALKKSLRETDIIGRYGGDEFMIILPETPVDQSLVPLRRIHTLIANYKIKQDHLSISAGVSGFPGEGPILAKKLIEVADKSLYLSKTHGKNQISIKGKLVRNQKGN